MERTKHLALLLGLALTLAVVQLVGCAGAEPARAAAPAAAPAVVEADAPARLALAEDAYQAGDYERAHELFQAALRDSEGLTNAQRAAAGSRLGRIQSILHQRTIAGPPEPAGPEEAAPAPEQAPVAVAEAEPAAREPAAEEEAEPAPEPEAEPAEEAPAPEQEPPPEPEPEPAEEAVDPEAARAEASALLADVEELLAGDQPAEAVPHVEALDELRQHLPAEGRARYDLARAAAREATGEPGALSEDERAARAQEQFDLGRRAFKEDDYPRAELHLDAAVSYDVGIGWWDNRTLRRTRRAIAEALAEVEADLGRARQLHQAGHYEQAAALLEQLVQRKAAIAQDPEPARELLAQVQADQAEALKQAVERERQIAADLLEAARAGVDEQDYDAAAQALQEVLGRAEHLTVEQAEQFKALGAAVEQATGVSPVLSGPERLARARQLYEWGMDAYEDGRYATAEELLLQVQRLDAGLGARREGKAARTLAELMPVLEQLRADHQRARQLYEEGQYAEAGALAKKIQGSGVNIGDEKMAELHELLASIEEAKAEQERQQVAARKEQAVEALNRAGELVASEQYQEAADQLAALSAHVDDLDSAQNQRYDQLCAAVEKATGLMPWASPQEALARAKQYYEWGMDAYKADRYAQAEEFLARADALPVDLGRRRERRLSAALAEIRPALEAMRADHAQARQLVKAGDYAQAVALLEKVRASGISMGDGADAQVARLLAEAREGVAEQERRQLEAHRKRVAQLLAEAEKLGGEGQYGAAMGKLALLEELAEYVTPEQKAQADRLRSALARAAEAAEARARLAEAERLARKAEGMLKARRMVDEKLEAAEHAVAREEFGRAEALLEQARAALDGLEAAEAGVSEMIALIEQKQAEVQRAARTAARRAEVQERLNALATEARALLGQDVLAAERKVRQMAQVAGEADVELTPQQQTVRELVLSSVEALYGAQRRTMADTFEDLTDVARDYMEEGEPAKAAQMLSLAEHARDDVLDEGDKARAQQMLAEARAAAQGQKEAAQRLKGMIKAAAEAAEGPRAGLAGIESALETARQERLEPALLAGVLQAAAEALSGPVRLSIQQSLRALEGVADAQLAAAGPVLWRRLAEHYLAAEAPEQARPYLAKLASAQAGEASAWAGARLASIDALIATAQQARTLEVGAEAERVLALAEQLHALVREGRLEQAPAVESELAEARLELQVARAEMALDRGAYMEAARLLEKAPTAKAEPAVVDAVYRPVKQRLEELRTAATKLARAQQAMAEHDLEEAGRLLTEARQAGALDGPLAVKAEVLGAVLDSVLAGQEEALALEAAREQMLRDVRLELAQARQRADAWRRYYAAAKAFLTGQADVTAVRQVLADPAGLEPSEEAHARRIAEALTGGAGVSPGAGLLAEAEAAYVRGDYIEAAALLAELRDLPPADVGAAVMAEADRIEAQIDAREAEARDLYAQAVRAYRADDAERVRELTAQLRRQYSHTRAYAERK